MSKVKLLWIAGIFSAASYGNTVPVKATSLLVVSGVAADYHLEVSLPESQQSVTIHQLFIPFHAALTQLSGGELPKSSVTSEVRVTFNLFNANCSAFAVFKAESEQSVSGRAVTQKCEIKHPGTYAGLASVCLNGRVVGLKSADLCHSVMGNITFK